MKYQWLRREFLVNLNLSLELIKCNKLPFGGMPEMVTVNF